MAMTEGQLRGQANLDAANAEALEQAKVTMQEWLDQAIKDENEAAARAMAVSVVLIERQINRLFEAAR
jgi:pyridoxine/pyridoxamine 5'-phosphate oxidase